MAASKESGKEDGGSCGELDASGCTELNEFISEKSTNLKDSVDLYIEPYSIGPNIPLRKGT